MCYTPSVVEKPIYRFLHLVFALGTLHLIVLVGLEGQRFFQLRHEIQQTQKSQSRLQQQVANLTEEIDAAQTGQYREAMARRMGYVQKSEVLYPVGQIKVPTSISSKH